MVYYVGTTREVCVGDIVIGCGRVDGRNLNGLRGCVIEIRRDCGIHALCVRFNYDTGDSFAWYVGYENIRPADAIGEDGKCHCYVCGAEITHDMNLGARLFRDSGLCDECVAKQIKNVNGYHFGKGLAYAYAKDKITMGVEIEIDDPEDSGDASATIRNIIRLARRNKYPLIMSHERDGSLDYAGFESVTAPLTIGEWKSEAVQSQIKMLFESAEENGYALCDGTHAGLHVHIGRKDLCGTDREISDAVGLLMGWAVTRLWDSGFKRLSRRECLEYCHLLDNGGDKGLYDTNAAYDRYHAVNIENSKTIELRIFGGATCLDDVLVAVDVCYMLAKWATKKINAFNKRKSYSAKAHKYDDALTYADRITWASLVKYSKFPEITLKRMRECGIDF